MAIVTSRSRISVLEVWLLSSLLLEVLTERWTRVFLSVRIFQSVRYLVLRQVNGPATLRLSVVSSSSQVFSAAAASPFPSLMWLCLSGCSCCLCYCGPSGCPVGRPSVGRPAALWPACVSIWRVGPVPSGDTGGVGRSTRTCRDIQSDN